MVGAALTSFIGELLVYPSIYFIWQSRSLRRTPLFPGRAGAGRLLELALLTGTRVNS